MGKEDFSILFNLASGTEIVAGKAYQYFVDWNTLANFGDDYIMTYTAHSNFGAFTQTNPVFIECNWGNTNAIVAKDSYGNEQSNIIGIFNPTYLSATTLTYDTTQMDNVPVYIENVYGLAKQFTISFTQQITATKSPIAFTFSNFAILMNFRRVHKNK
jgi:hypothetical protein